MVLREFIVDVRKSSIGRLAAMVTIASAVALVPAMGIAVAVSPASAARAAATASVPRCATASFGVWVGTTTGAAGSRTAEFGFTNNSSKTCSLYGYPRVEMLTKSGKNLSTTDEQAPGAMGVQEKTVVLAPGKRRTSVSCTPVRDRLRELDLPDFRRLAVHPTAEHRVDRAARIAHADRALRWHDRAPALWDRPPHTCHRQALPVAPAGSGGHVARPPRSVTQASNRARCDIPPAQRPPDGA